MRSDLRRAASPVSCSEVVAGDVDDEVGAAPAAGPDLDLAGGVEGDDVAVGDGAGAQRLSYTRVGLSGKKLGDAVVYPMRAP